MMRGRGGLTEELETNEFTHLYRYRLSEASLDSYLGEVCPAKGPRRGRVGIVNAPEPRPAR